MKNGGRRIAGQILSDTRFLNSSRRRDGSGDFAGSPARIVGSFSFDISAHFNVHFGGQMKNKAVWISCIVTALFCGRPANASVIITLDQEGGNVVATGSGTVNLAGLGSPNQGQFAPLINPGFARLIIGGVAGSPGLTDAYLDVLFGPPDIAVGGAIMQTLASAATGDLLGLTGSSGQEACSQITSSFRAAMFPARSYLVLLPGITPPSRLSAQTMAPIPGPGDPARAPTP
jgi:hypothetical protein